MLLRKRCLCFGFLLFVVFACSVPDERSSAPILSSSESAGSATEIENAHAMSFVIMKSNGSIIREHSAGVNQADGKTFTTDTPLRIASITKTFVAVATLRLWERGRFDIHAPISSLLDEGLDDLLRENGYDTANISPRHLLMQTSGLADHVSDQYFELILNEPDKEWTREEQIRLAMDNHDPVGEPGQGFSYSDTGYILLGHLLERSEGASIASIVRREIGYEKIGLSNTWWEKLETSPPSAKPRASQFVDGMDVSRLNPTIDLYGGGGLVSTAQDMALFMSAVMRGDFFEQPETLQVMLFAPGHPSPDQYRIGLSFDIITGHSVYYHNGYWGTFAGFVPTLNIAFAGAVADQENHSQLNDLLWKEIEALASIK